MKQLLILSGKGGTGKTTIASALIKLANVRAYADCDVDAPNLHLIMKQISKPQTSDFYGMPKAEINMDLCMQCGLCMQNCRFDAITYHKEGYQIDLFGCEGCGVCEYICPYNAIRLKDSVAGNLMLYHDDFVFSTAQLKMGSGTSGKLVAEVKKNMKTHSNEVQLAIIDGSPGIGCPVIASISGVDMVLIVTEPSVSGINDMERIINTVRIFKTNAAVCVNKYDINMENTRKIEDFCEANNLPFVGKIPYDAQAVKAINEGKSIIDEETLSGAATKEVYEKMMELLFNQNQ